MKTGLGSGVRDKITGFSGVATGRVEYLTGCHQVLITPQCKPGGEFQEPRWFDEQRVQADAGVASVQIENGEHPGADVAAPVR